MIRLFTASFLAVFALLLFSGCATFRAERTSAQAPVNRATGIPSDNFVVGGGWFVRFAAPTAGTVYYADRATGTLILTDFLQAGEIIEIDAMDNPKEMREMLGIPLSAAQFRLFFVPYTRDGSDWDRIPDYVWDDQWDRTPQRRR